jgi:uncharacterized protein (DUF58 family)
MNKRILLFLLPVIIGLIASATGYSLAWRLFIIALLVPLISFSWTFFSLRGIKSEIGTLPPKSRVGEVIHGKLKLTNLNRIPKLLLNVQENTDVPGYSNLSEINLPSRGTITVESDIRFSRRGQYSAGSYSISLHDPLGLFSRSIIIGSPQKILVYPGVIDLAFFYPQSYVYQGYGPGRWLASQISPNVASIREYVNGDSLKNIHWRTTAHSSKLMVKVFDPDRSHSSVKTIWVVLDMFQSSQAGSGLQSTEEYGITLASSILKKYIESGWPVGLTASAEQPYFFAPQTGNNHLENMNIALATMKAIGQIPIEQLLVNETACFGLNILTIVITPSWNEKLVRSLLQIRRQQGVVAAILLDSHSFGALNYIQSVPFSLMQNGIQVYVVKKDDNLTAVMDSRKQ